MTKRNSKSKAPKRPKPQLKRLKRQAVDYDFEGGALTSDGGLLLLREIDRRLNVIQRMDAIIPDPRNQDCILHTQAEMLASRIFAIAAGYEDGNDHQQLRHDPAFQVAAGRPPAEHRYEEKDVHPLASPSTLCRLENRATQKACMLLSELLVDIFIESFDEPPEEIILDYDATDDPTHGDQELNYFNGFYDGYCYLPLYVFCGDQLLCAYLRPSSVGAAHNTTAVAKLLVQKIRTHWPNVKIIVRGDSGFAVERLLRWCDEHEVNYLFGFQKNAVLQRELAGEMAVAMIQHEASDETQRRFKWFRYKAGSWDRHRWMIGKAEYSDQGPNPRFIVTNLASVDGIVDSTYHRPLINGKRVHCAKKMGTQCSPMIHPRMFYETMYCPRGEMENRIKEQQLCLFADRTSCSRFVSNQFRLLLSSFAYVLMDGVRRLALKGTKQSRWRIDTIRLKLLKIASRVRVTCRRVVFHLASHHPFADVFNAALIRLCRSG